MRMTEGSALDLKERNPRALQGLVEEHTDALFAVALGLGLSEVDAEDILQETFVAFLGALDRFEGQSSVRTYLYSILVHKAKDLWRKKGREQPLGAIDAIFEERLDVRGMWMKPPLGPEDKALNQELGRWIGECLGGLSVEQRAAFHLKEVAEQDTGSICKILDVTTTNLGVLLFRARNRLRECLEKKWR